MNTGAQSPDGQNVIDIKLRRHPDGIRVRVWVDPTIEAFFERWGGGEQEDIRGSGRLWRPYRSPSFIHITDEAPLPPLQLWSVPGGHILREQNDQFTLLAPGYNLIVDNGATNLSMIRLVGASSPNGIDFLCDAVVSRSELERIAGKIRRASEVFYAEYIQPVGTRIHVVATPVVKVAE